MFGKKSEVKDKLSGPRSLPGIVSKQLVSQFKLDPDLAALLRSVSKENGDGGHLIRVFDEAETGVKKVTIKDYSSFDTMPNLVIYEGSYNDSTKEVSLEAKKPFGEPVKFFTEEEIRQKIESLKEPGSTVFFYQARGSNLGGPLGRGAAVVELNPGKGKKYLVNSADVDGMEPVGKGTKLWDSDKPKDIANWIKDSLHKRLY